MKGERTKGRKGEGKEEGRWNKVVRDEWISEQENKDTSN
jgi:hypothetical protein